MTELTTTTADGLHITVRMPDNHAWVRGSLERACAAEARRQLEAAPTPDPAYPRPGLCRAPRRRGRPRG